VGRVLLEEVCGEKEELTFEDFVDYTNRVMEEKMWFWKFLWTI
jgi:hypothetical protein